MRLLAPGFKNLQQNLSRGQRALLELQRDMSEGTPEVVKQTLISLWRGDITKICTDAIVNAANYYLMGGGGVDGAIHTAAGPLLLEECKGISPCPDGDAKITKGYNLPSKYVIHTVGPRNRNPTTLSNCYRNCLTLAMENHIRSIAFPCIATGIYGYPNEDAAKVALENSKTFLTNNPGCLEEIIFCVFLQKDFEIYKKHLPNYFAEKEYRIFDKAHPRQV